MLLKLSMMDDYAWRDVFDFLSPTDGREKLALISGMGDRRFSGICQKWLHEWTRDVRLGQICMIKPPPWGRKKKKKKAWNIGTTFYLLGCIKGRMDQSWKETPWKEARIAETEMPDNISDFESIRIYYLDANVLQLMRLMQPIFNNVNLHINCVKSLDRTRIALSHLMPFFTGGIDCVYLTSHICHFLLTIRDRFPAQFLSIKKLDIHYLCKTDLTTELVELLLRWLGTRREDGEQRVLHLAYFYFSLELLGCIRQHFLDATGQATSSGSQNPGQLRTSRSR